MAGEPLVGDENTLEKERLPGIFLKNRAYLRRLWEKFHLPLPSKIEINCSKYGLSARIKTGGWPIGAEI